MKYEKFKQYILKHGTRTTKGSWYLKDEDDRTTYADAVELDLSTLKHGYRTMSIYVEDDGEVRLIKVYSELDTYRYNFENDRIEIYDGNLDNPFRDLAPNPWSEVHVDDDGNLVLEDDADIIRNDKREIEKIVRDYIKTHRDELKETYKEFKSDLEACIKENEEMIVLSKKRIERAKAALTRLEAARIRLSTPEFLENPQPGDRFMTRDKQVAFFTRKVTYSDGEEQLHWTVEKPKEGCAEGYGFSTLVNGRFCEEHKETLDIIKKLDK